MSLNGTPFCASQLAQVWRRSCQRKFLIPARFNAFCHRPVIQGIYFGTGRYPGFTDVASTSPSGAVTQTIYALKDTGADVGVLQSSGAKLVTQTLNVASSPRTIASPATVDLATKMAGT